MELSLRKAKTVEVYEGRGLAFQSHHSPLSNMYSCHVVYDGRDFEALEIAYQYARAKICGYRREAELIADTTCAYKAKAYTKDFKDTKEWISRKVKLMTELQVFTQQGMQTVATRIWEEETLRSNH